MNILVCSLGNKIAAKACISKMGDVFYFSSDLRPSVLFDCNVVMCGSTVNGSDIGAILEEGKYAYAKKASGNAALEQQMQLFTLSNMDEDCNTKQEQKPMPYTVLVLPGSTETEIF